MVIQNNAEMNDRRLLNHISFFYAMRYVYLLLGCLRERKFKPSDDDECLGKGDKYICRSLNPHVNALRRGNVDVMLQNTGVDHGNGNKHKGGEDSRNGIKVDLQFAKPGVNNH